jgi:hypothetical protein
MTTGAPEIVPEALRHRLVSWDWRHDKMAARIMEEFTLRLPRDRELIRQLAFVRVQQGVKTRQGARRLGMLGE